MNFISTFDELNKLYEEKAFGQKIKLNKRSLKEAILDNLDDALYTPGVWGVEFVGEECICFDNEKEAREYFAQLDENNIYADSEGIELFKVIDTNGNTETVDSISVYNEALTEAAEDEEIEITDDEAAVEEVPAEEPVVEDAPRQIICECDKCGALVIKDEADIVVDEESDLVNIEDECQFCEEAKGYKIVGVVAPYEVVEEETPIDDKIVDEPEMTEDEAYIDESLTETSNKNKMRVADVEYEDDDGEDVHVLVFADDLTEDDLTDLLYDRGMTSVEVNRIFEDAIDPFSVNKLGRIKPGDVVRVLD